MKKLLKKSVVISVVSLSVLTAVGVTVLNVRANSSVDTVALETGEITRVVRISGKVTPAQDVSLSFETSGVISQINKSVGESVARGEMLVRLNSSTVSTEVQRAEADLTSARAELAKLDSAGKYETSIDNARRSLVQALVDAYTAGDDAVHNKTDQFITNPRGARPELLSAFRGYYDLRNSINTNRVLLEYMLDDWKVMATSLSRDTFTEDKLSTTKSNLNKVTLFMSDVSRAVNMFEASDSLTQSTIDKYKNDVLLSRDNLARANQTIISEENKLRNLLADVPVQVARVDAARAALETYRSQLSKTTLSSPIAGVVSNVDAKVGQVTTPGVPLITIISREHLIETFVPEVSIAGIQVGNTAQVTLDAYGADVVFNAFVSHIDPAETIKDGVSTYKVRLAFADQDSRIRPGMTANVEIEIFKKIDTQYIPARAVVQESSGSYVYILVNKTQEKRAVTLGERDSKGNVEILSGISSTDRIILNPNLVK